MGSSIETTITFTIIMAFLVFLITIPSSVYEDTLEMTVDGVNKLRHYMDDDEVINTARIGGESVNDTSAERLNTMISGLSDLIWISIGVGEGDGNG